MPLVQAKCTNCGANLKIDRLKDAATCPYCGSAFIVEKAINNYNTTNHISAEAVNIYNNASNDFIIRGGVLERYNGAAVEIVIPNDVKIIRGEHPYCGVFQDCVGITSVIIPDSVQEIGYGSFKGCTALTSVTIPDSVLKIGDGAFLGCRSLTSITIPNSVQEIGKGAFGDCSSITTVTIPHSLEKLSSTFSNCCSLTSVVIPNSVKIISGAFSGCTSLASVTIPDSVQVIGDDAFNNCLSLKSITIPHSVQKIGKSAFNNCNSLTSVNIPDSVQVIEDGAFARCNSLQSIVIPESVHYLGVSAFYCCTSLRHVVIRGSLDGLNLKYKYDLIFQGCSIQTYETPDAKSGGCYIATAVYGSYDCPEVWTLRRFRDYTLHGTWYGRVFIRLYYAISPKLVRWFGNAHWFQAIFKPFLDRIVNKLQRKGIESTPYQDKY